MWDLYLGPVPGHELQRGIFCSLTAYLGYMTVVAPGVRVLLVPQFGCLVSHSHRFSNSYVSHVGFMALGIHKPGTESTATLASI